MTERGNGVLLRTRALASRAAQQPWALADDAAEDAIPRQPGAELRESAHGDREPGCAVELARDEFVRRVSESTQEHLAVATPPNMFAALTDQCCIGC